MYGGAFGEAVWSIRAYGFFNPVCYTHNVRELYTYIIIGSVLYTALQTARLKSTANLDLSWSMQMMNMYGTARQAHGVREQDQLGLSLT